MIPDELVQAVADARAVTVLTGAGVSAESGVPTFREAQTGLWARFDPLQLATPEAFAADPNNRLEKRLATIQKAKRNGAA